MLTLEILYAVLLGLDPEQLVHLDEKWIVFCRNIKHEMHFGRSPLQALKVCVEDQYLRPKVLELFAQISEGVKTPGLSYRQREALIALRHAKVSSLSRLCQILGTDRSNTHKRLNALVNKGFAVKFSRPGGVHYFALPGPVDRSLKAGIHEIFASLLAEAEAQPQASAKK